MPQPMWAGASRAASLPLALAGFVFLPALAAAQVRTQPQPQPPQRPPVTQQPLKESPLLAGPDVVIDKVSIVENNASSGGSGPVLRADAYVTLRNAGKADVVFPAGSVVVTGAAGSGGLRFSADTARTALVLKPGQTATETIHTGDPCQGWSSAAVTFRADPGGVVAEAQKGNNATTITPAVSNPTAADLVVSALDLVKLSAKSGDWSDLKVVVKNAGSGPVLICPGNVVFKETATPVSAKYGLRSSTYTYQASAASSSSSSSSGGAVQTDVSPSYPFVVILPGGTQPFYLKSACRLGDTPAPAQWTVTLNPTGAVREGNRANNDGTAQLRTCY